MLQAAKLMLLNQFDAALCTLQHCIDQCPEEAWDQRVANHTFNQVVFHALFYADVYLGRNFDSHREQHFHREHKAYFRDYEELEDRLPVNRYDRPTTSKYLAHCRQKAARSIATETAQTLSSPCGFPRRDFSRAELYVYLTRHVQHHAAQLSLRLRVDHGRDVPWVGSGWLTNKPT